MERLEIVEFEAEIPRFDVRLDHRLEIGEFGVEAEEGEGLAELGDGDGAVGVFVEEVEDAAEADGVQARAAEAEG